MFVLPGTCDIYIYISYTGYTYIHRPQGSDTGNHNVLYSSYLYNPDDGLIIIHESTSSLFHGNLNILSLRY